MSAIPPHTRPLCVLVVDADANAAGSRSDLLAACGFVALTAADGEAALTAVLAERPDVVVAGLRAPECLGAELARRVVAARLRPRPFLVAVAGDDGAERPGAEPAGFDLVLAPSVPPAVLVGVLRRIARAIR